MLVNYGKNVADAIIAGDMAALGRLMKNLGAAVSDAMVSSVQSACSSAYTYKDKCKTCLTSAHAHVDTLTTEVERLIGVLADVNGNYLSAAESALVSQCSCIHSSHHLACLFSHSFPTSLLPVESPTLTVSWTNSIWRRKRSLR